MNVQRLRVPAGFMYGLAFLFLADPAPLCLGMGCLLAGLGVGIRVWAAGHLERWKTLSTSGPYGYTRNPLYLGSFLLGLGLSVAAASLVLLLLFLFLFVLLYVPVMRREEEELQEMYGPDYTEYRTRVPLLVPRRSVDPLLSQKKTRFEWKRVWKNREYNAVVGYLAVSLFLVVRMTWFS